MRIFVSAETKLDCIAIAASNGANNDVFMSPVMLPEILANNNEPNVLSNLGIQLWHRHLAAEVAFIGWKPEPQITSTVAPP